MLGRPIPVRWRASAFGAPARCGLVDWVLWLAGLTLPVTWTNRRPSRRRPREGLDDLQVLHSLEVALCSAAGWHRRTEIQQNDVVVIDTHRSKLTSDDAAPLLLLACSSCTKGRRPGRPAAARRRAAGDQLAAAAAAATTTCRTETTATRPTAAKPRRGRQVRYMTRGGRTCLCCPS